ncbi:Cation channel sperm-associated protein subunit delta [Manis javanica]|nr:Cation channel sperm-associated protein subunit delta [Manis javanica]
MNRKLRSFTELGVCPLMPHLLTTYPRATWHTTPSSWQNRLIPSNPGASRPCASSSRSGALRAGGAHVRQRAQHKKTHNVHHLSGHRRQGNFLCGPQATDGAHLSRLRLEPESEKELKNQTSGAQNAERKHARGILDTMALSDSYSYVIERDAYDPNFRGQKATKDQVVHYPYDRLGCPDLVYYDTPWKPVVEMWRKGKFQEVVHTEYVLLEVNGLFTYTYSLSARSALCRAQPQNWTTVMQPAGGEGRSAWHREARSCPSLGYLAFLYQTQAKAP